MAERFIKKIVLPATENKRSENLKALLAFALFFNGYNCMAQLKIIDSVIHYSKKNKIINYTHAHYPGVGAAAVNRGTLYILRNKGGLEYRILDDTYGLDFIRSMRHCGYNNRSDTSFVDYGKKAAELEENLLAYVDYEVLYPDSFAKYWYKDPSRQAVTFTESKDHYHFQIKLLKPEMSGDSLALIKSSVSQYDILKKGYRLSAYSFTTIAMLGDVEMTDSSRTTYTYGNVSEKEVLKKINGFVPCKKREPYDEKLPGDTTTVFPSFQLPDTTGRDFSSAQCTAKYVLVEFWYKSCAPCMANIKQLKEVRNAFGGERVEILAINDVDKYDKELRGFLKKYKVNYNVLFNARPLGQRLRITAHPSTYIYEAKTGKIVYRFVGGGGNYAHEISDTLHGLLGD